MKIVFIYNGTENLGIEYLSSFLKSKGHEIYLLLDPDIFGEQLINSKFLSRLFSIDKEILKRTIKFKPGLVAFSTYTGNYRWCLKIAQSIKKLADIPIVFGGVHTTAVPETVLSNDFIDFAIIGEGELAILDLIEHLEKGGGQEELLNISNICFRYEGSFQVNSPRPYIKNLDSLPFPDKALFYDKVPFLERSYHNLRYCSREWDKSCARLSRPSLPWCAAGNILPLFEKKNY